MSSSVKPRMCSLLAEASSAVCDGAQIVLGLDQRGLALLVVLERNGLALEQVLGARVLDLGEVERRLRLVHAGHRRNVVVLRLHRVGGFDHEQWLALGDAVARPHQQLGEPAGIGREHRRRAILVDRDLAFGDVFSPERPFGDRLNGQAGPFGRGRRVALQSLAGLAGDIRMLGLAVADLGKAVDRRAGKRQNGHGHGPLPPAKRLQSLDKIVKHTARIKSAMIPAETASPVR